MSNYRLTYREVMFNNAPGGTSMTHAILRFPAVKVSSGLPRSTLYLRISQGLWTKLISLGARIVGWPANEVEALNSARIAGKSDKEIRSIVKQLENNRQMIGKEMLAQHTKGETL